MNNINLIEQPYAIDDIYYHNDYNIIITNLNVLTISKLDKYNNKIIKSNLLNREKKRNFEKNNENNNENNKIIEFNNLNKRQKIK